MLMTALATSSGQLGWLLGLDRIRWSDPQAVLAWRYELEPWHWALIILASVVGASLTYRHLLGPRYGRAALTVVRALILIVVAALLAGPMIKVLDTRTRNDWFIMLVDRSESMKINDAADPAEAGPPGAPVARDAALRRALERDLGHFTDEAFLRDRHLLWLGFDESTYELTAPDHDDATWADPEGRATLLRTALEQALRRTAGRPVGGIALFTDGRSGQSTGSGLVRRLNQRGARVFPVLIGGDVEQLDLSIARVDAPRKAFVNDDVPVRVWIQHYPVEAQPDPKRIRLRLVDAATDQVVDERSPGEAEPGRPVTLTGRSEAIGQATWRVELTYDAPDPTTRSDPVPANNLRRVDVELIDRPIRVLYIEGYPRWEYRFLKNLLVRERSLSSSMMLISADRQFAQEGDEPIARLPRTPSEWAPYDVILIGDAPVDTLSSEQMAMLRDHVAARGAGLIWIGGPRSTPRGYGTTALSSLLPMRRPGSVVRSEETSVALRPTPHAEALSVLRLHASGAERADAWPEDLPRLRWVQDVGRLKRTAEVLGASAEPQESPIPIVMRMRYGAGQAIYLATDETWRYRYGRGERYFGQLWTGLIRMLGRHRIQQRARTVDLKVSHHRVEVSQTVVVELDLDDAVLVPREVPRIAVSVERDGEDDSIEQFVLMPRQDLSAAEREIGGARYRATWRPTVAGRFHLRVVEPALNDIEITQVIEVDRPDAELRHTRPDFERLSELASQTGVERVYRLGDLEQLAQDADSRAEATDDDETEPLWDSPLALLIILTLLTTEWIGRKLIRLI
ncbi:MAG: hypothetical protein CMJ18_22775 [Phycisphaeraceae bacterium]|nr:hypothetical protein [Phycisphaeraceae bacterium]